MPSRKCHALLGLLVATVTTAFTSPSVLTPVQKIPRSPVLSHWQSLSRSSVRRSFKFPLFATSPDAIQKWIDLLAKPETLSRLLLDSFQVPELAQGVEETYVERENLEAAIQAYAETPVPTQYMVVVGPRGCGKSCLVRKVLRDRKKVVYVQLSSSVRLIADEIRAGFIRANLGLSETVRIDLKDVFLPFKGCVGAEKPVIVVELDSQVPADYVTTQSQELKRIVCDERLAHGILVLSDANAAFKLNPDDARQRFLWVSDFDEAETKAFLDKLDVPFTLGKAHDGPHSMFRRRLSDEVGTNAAFLATLAVEANTNAAAAGEGKGSNASERLEAKSTAVRAVFEDFCQRQLDYAAKVVKSSINSIPVTKLVMAKLLASGDGAIPFSEINDLNEIALMEELKNKNRRAIAYNSETKRFVWYSKAHETAARAYFEEELSRRKQKWFGLRRFFMEKSSSK